MGKEKEEEEEEEEHLPRKPAKVIQAKLLEHTKKPTKTEQSQRKKAIL